MTTPPTIGFIGIGVMGGSMAGHLLAAGYRLTVYTRTAAKAETLVERGAEFASSIAALASLSDIIVTMVGFPHDVEQVYLGEAGVLAHARPGSYCIDMTTSRPDIAVRIARDAQARGIHALDAPVSGGDIGAREARLSIMVGGEHDTFLAMLPYLQCMGSKIVFQGSAGSGQHCKMCNQITIAATMIGVCESMAYARRAGLNPEMVLQSISSGAAASWLLDNLAPRMMAADFAPGFYVKHFIKDMRIALESASMMGLDMPGLALARQLYEQLSDRGADHLGTQALFQLYDAGERPGQDIA